VRRRRPGGHAGLGASGVTDVAPVAVGAAPPGQRPCRVRGLERDARQPAGLAHEAASGRVIFGMDGVTQAGAGLGLPLRMRGRAGERARGRGQPGTKESTYACGQELARKSLQLSSVVTPSLLAL